jgi:hypothetical protein
LLLSADRRFDSYVRVFRSRRTNLSRERAIARWMALMCELTIAEHRLLFQN